ncbi:MAG: NADH-quinone oxidoreductase subunit N [Bdellovibrionaceae bacterium]|nr:NADH-quinone oxidoreductase subunit N [Pseudobdellovibrionaceae bacterium]
MNMQLLQDVVLVSPLIALFAMSLLPVMMKVFQGNREPNPYVTLFIGFIGLSLATGLTAALSGADKTAFSGAIVFDGITAWMSYLVYLITAVALMLSFDHVATRGRQFAEFVFLMLSSVLGMIILIMSNDLIVTFIGIETMSLCLYILCAMSKEDVLSKEAAFKYFILGSFASAIFLYGIAFIYGTVGSTIFPDILESVGTLISTNTLFVVGLAMVTLGFAFKVSVFPLHAWTPDVYHGAPTPVTAFMATAVKASTFVAFLRLFESEGYGDAVQFQNVLQWLAVLTMLIGNVAAVMQDNFKRMLAYSSIAHSGYIMVGLIAAGFGNNFDAGATSVIFYLFSYALMTLGTFAVVAMFEKAENSTVGMNELKGMANRYPLLSLSLTVLLLSLAGIPPTLGFFGKFYLFSAAIEQDMYWLVLWGVINSVISVYYYLRPIVMMYMSDDVPVEIVGTNGMTRLTVIFTAALIVVLGLMSSPVLKAVQRSVTNLF